LEKKKKDSPHKIAARKVAEAERLRRAGELEASEAACREALEIDPKIRVEALAALGATLNDQGRVEESLAAYEESLGEQADQPNIYSALALICLARGSAGKALLLAEKACELAPGLASAKVTRATVLDQSGYIDEAFSELSLAYRVAPRELENITALTIFVARRGLSPAVIQQGEWHDCEAAALGAFHTGSMDVSYLAAAAEAILCAEYDFLVLGAETDGASHQRLANDELFIRLLQECVVTYSVIEIFCAQLRRAICLLHQNCDELPVAAARLAATLALQNYDNGYVVWADAEEDKLLAGEAERLREVLQAAKSNVTGATRAALQLYAMYRPLAQYSGAGAILDLPLGGEAGRLVLLTIREMRELASGVERMPNFADSMPGEISPPADRPFLPWAHFPVPDPGSLMVYLRRLFPGYSPPGWSSDGCDVLVPGCGSGEVATHMALYFPASRVSAIDWQKPALSCGDRRALKIGVENFKFSAGDAMSAGAGERRFQFIDARDAIHEFPAALLAVLAKLLVSGGLLRLDVAGRDHAEIVRVAFELGASQAQGSLQFARRDIAQSGHEACQYLRRQENFTI